MIFFTVWVLEIKLQLSVLAVSSFTLGPVSECFLINYSKNLVNVHFSSLNVKAYYYVFVVFHI